jgi:hypothetical protein
LSLLFFRGFPAVDEITHRIILQEVDKNGQTKILYIIFKIALKYNLAFAGESENK